MFAVSVAAIPQPEQPAGQPGTGLPCLATYKITLELVDQADRGWFQSRCDGALAVRPHHRVGVPVGDIGRDSPPQPARLPRRTGGWRGHCCSSPSHDSCRRLLRTRSSPRPRPSVAVAVPQPRASRTKNAGDIRPQRCEPVVGGQRAALGAERAAGCSGTVHVRRDGANRTDIGPRETGPGMGS
jgi:hypothetical protein